MNAKKHPGGESSALLILVATVATAVVTGTVALLVATASPVPRSISESTAPQPGSLEVYGDDGFELGFQGFAGRVPDTKKPQLTAYFTRESYRPGQAAELVVTDSARGVTLRFFRTGGESRETMPNDVMLGTPVSKPVMLGTIQGRRSFTLRLGNWTSGVYFARLTCGRRVGYAPFVLAPTRLGEHRIAVVMPTMTWQAYNFRDDDGDGHGDTWYAGWRTNKALLIRPFLNRGVPPHWKRYDAPFIRWLTHRHRIVDYLSDAELRAVPDGRELADAYTLIVFSGHHEYVTTHEYDVVEQYRDLGGNLAFLSANNFFWKTDLKDNVMTRVALWRKLGRPEAALIGVQYRANDDGSRRAPWIVRNRGAVPWLFGSAEIGNGDAIGNGGIEIDKTAPSSPKNIRILAEIPDLYGPGFTGQMTYYQTAAGAKVFAAGAFSLAKDAWGATETALLTNLLTKLSAK